MATVLLTLAPGNPVTDVSPNWCGFYVAARAKRPFRPPLFTWHLNSHLCLQPPPGSLGVLTEAVKLALNALSLWGLYFPGHRGVRGGWLGVRGVVVEGGFAPRLRDSHERQSVHVCPQRNVLERFPLSAKAISCPLWTRVCGGARRWRSLLIVSPFPATLSSSLSPNAPSDRHFTFKLLISMPAQAVWQPGGLAVALSDGMSSMMSARLRGWYFLEVAAKQLGGRDNWCFSYEVLIWIFMQRALDKTFF